MKKLTSVILSLSVVFAGASVASAESNVDFSIRSIESSPCFIDVEDLEPENISKYNNYNEDLTYEENGNTYAFIGDKSYEFVYDFALGKTETSKYDLEDYTLLDSAADKSWYRVYNHYFNRYETTGCYKVVIEANGDFESLQDASEENFPTSMSGFYDLLTTRLPISSTVRSQNAYEYSTRSIISDPQGKGDGGGSWLVPEDVLNFGKIVIYVGYSFSDNKFEPGENIDAYFSINNTINFQTNMFNRTWFNNEVRHYNDGPTIFETSTENNYAILENVISAGEYHLSGPTITDSTVRNNKITISWNPVSGANGYQIVKISDNISIIEFTLEEETFTTNDNQITLDLVSDSNILECFTVHALNADKVPGTYSQEVCAGSPFSDVDPTSWYARYTNKAASKEYVRGYTNDAGDLTGRYGPENSITKAEALKITGEITDRYVRASQFGFELPYSVPAKFKSHWAYDYIWGFNIVEIDLLARIDDFNPDEAITRGELMHLLAEALEAKVPEYSSYSFDDLDGYRYADDIEFFKELGVVSGYGNSNNFGVNSPLLRAEAAKIFVEISEKFTMSWPNQEML